MSGLLVSGAREFGIRLNDGQIAMFEAFTDLLLDWNRKLNLTRITEPDDIAIKHYLDSLSLLKFIEIPPGSMIIDVGTGAGFPGIPLKIALPGLKLTLLDSVRKRLAFLEEAVARLGLTDVRIVHGRAEDVGRDGAHREKHDFAVSRAVAGLSVLAELCIPFCRVGGKLAAYKGPDLNEEVKQASNAIRILGGEIEAVHEFVLPHSDLQRTLAIVGKIKPTPETYPRKAGTVEKRPL